MSVFRFTHLEENPKVCTQIFFVYVCVSFAVASFIRMLKNFGSNFATKNGSDRPPTTPQQFMTPFQSF